MDQWSLRILVDRSRNLFRLVAGTRHEHHTFLGLVDDANQLRAELHFSAKNRKGVSFSKQNRLLPAPFHLTSLFNVLSEMTSSEQASSLYRRSLEQVLPGNDAPRLKGNLLIHGNERRLRHLDELGTAPTFQYTCVEGRRLPVLEQFQTCCAVADRINRQNFIFTTYSPGLGATNCRAGLKAVVTHALKSEFPTIRKDGQFGTGDHRETVWKKNPGFHRNLPVDISLALYPMADSESTDDVLRHWHQRLKRTCRDVSRGVECAEPSMILNAGIG